MFGHQDSRLGGQWCELGKDPHHCLSQGIKKAPAGALLTPPFLDTQRTHTRRPCRIADNNHNRPPCRTPGIR